MKFVRFLFVLALLQAAPFLPAQSNVNPCPPDGSPPADMCYPQWNSDTCQWEGDTPFYDACGNEVCDAPDPSLECCGGDTYDPSGSQCCGGNIIDINDICCDDGSVAGAGQVCCSSGGLSTATNDADCCAGSVLDKTQVCCHGGPIDSALRFECKSVAQTPVWNVNVTPTQATVGSTINLVFTYTASGGALLWEDCVGELNPKTFPVVASGGGTESVTVTMPATEGSVTVAVPAHSGSFETCNGGSENFSGLATSQVQILATPDCSPHPKITKVQVSTKAVVNGRVVISTCANGSVSADAEDVAEYQVMQNYRQTVYGNGTTGRCPPPTTPVKDGLEYDGNLIRTYYRNYNNYSCSGGGGGCGYVECKGQSTLNTTTCACECPLTAEQCALQGKVLKDCECVDPCDAPAQPDKGVAEIQGDLVFKYLEYNDQATTFAEAAKEQTADPVKSAGPGAKVVRFLTGIYQAKEGDPALSDPAVLAVAPVNDLSVNGKLITDNSAPERDLKGSLTLTLVTGDASKLGLFYYDVKTSAYIAYTLGASIPVEAPGHSGCGIHTWHGYMVNVQAVATESGPFVLKATVTPESGSSAFTAEVTLLKLLHVDANRDGQITLDGADATSEQKPFRFWVNDDVDVEKPEEKDAEDVNPASGEANYKDDKVNGVRDLEDFTRLNLYVGGLQDGLLSGDIQVGLKWANLSGTAPSIKIWQNLSPGGGREYLTGIGTARKYVVNPEKLIGEVRGANAVMLPVDILNSLKVSSSQPYVHLLYEGVAPGKGQLVVVFKNRAGVEIGEGSGAWQEIKPFDEYYEHWTCGDTDDKGAVIVNDPWYVFGKRGMLFEYNQNEDGLSMPGSSTYGDYVVFVHGWRMKPYERRAFAETAFKRMYHQGYKGKFGFFSWPTEWVDYDGTGLKQEAATVVRAGWDPQHYDRCEVQARKSGAGPLRTLLLKLRDNRGYGANRIHVFAHSMGNVVVSEALRAHPAGDKLINRYVACQSAEVAHAYDPTADMDTQPWYLGISAELPDLYRYNPKSPRDVHWDALASSEKGDCYHKNLADRTINGFTNFYNGGDTALGKWEINQALKPDLTIRTWDNSYAYRFKLTNPPPPNSIGFPDPNGRDQYLKDPVGVLDPATWVHELEWTKDQFEILAHIIPARSKAAGAVGGLRGEFSGLERNFNGDYKNGTDSHSAQFLSNFATRKDFYFKLLDAFSITTPQL